MIPYAARPPEPIPADPDELRALVERNQATPDHAGQADAFLASRVVIGHGATRGGDFYRAFDAYADAQNWAPYLRMTVTAFGREMGRRFPRKRDKRGVSYQGVCLIGE